MVLWSGNTSISLKLPKSYFIILKFLQNTGEKCILTATNLINRLPNTMLNNKTPFEVLYNQQPTNSHIKSFGCLCYPVTLKTHKEKFESIATPHVFIGYPFNTKGYKVLDLSTRRLDVSKDVLFYENIFSFADSNFDLVLRKLSPTSDLFKTTFNIFDDVMRMLHMTLVYTTLPLQIHHLHMTLTLKPTNQALHHLLIFMMCTIPSHQYHQALHW